MNKTASNIFFEQEKFWINNYRENPEELIRLKYLMLNLPKEITNLIDVGCGNGQLINELSKHFSSDNIVGTDLSYSALSLIKDNKIQADISLLPIKNNSFSLTTCNEVLEHIKDNDFGNVISEIKRITKSYILITVPNDENLLTNRKVCPKCFCTFNPYYHVRSFNQDKLQKLFEPEFETIKIMEIPVIKYEQRASLYRFINFLKPFYMKQFQICPQCGYQISSEKITKSETLHLNKKINWTIPLSKKKNKWLLSLFIRKI